MPEEAAAEEVVRLLEREGLSVVDLRSEAQLRHETLAVVHISALYGTGRAHPWQASHRVELEPIDDGWRIVSIEAVP